MTLLPKAVIVASLFWIVPAISQPAPDPRQPAPPYGMMNPGMMGGFTERGPTGFRGMMGGGQSGSRGMMPMMSEMMGAWSSADHIDGRLAFVKAELKITEAQTTAWDAFADATRNNATSMSEMRKTMMSRLASPGTLPDRLALEDNAMTAHLAALKRTEDAVAKLYGVLTDEQKKIADNIVVGPMGMPMGMF
jgi:LTXXQ motif family protein